MRLDADEFADLRVAENAHFAPVRLGRDARRRQSKSASRAGENIRLLPITRVCRRIFAASSS
jgi:hypothetical protein